VGPADGTGPVADVSAPHDEGEPVAPKAAEELDSPASSLGQDQGSDVRPVARLVTGTPADGVRELRTLLSNATVRRWPMYLRNVRQVLRDATPPFDERAYGFGNLVDLLRAAHRDGVVRVDRDRQGVIRVFQGSLQGASVPPPSIEPVVIIDAEPEPV